MDYRGAFHIFMVVTNVMRNVSLSEPGYLCRIMAKSAARSLTDSLFRIKPPQRGCVAFCLVPGGFSPNVAHVLAAGSRHRHSRISNLQLIQTRLEGSGVGGCRMSFFFPHADARQVLFVYHF